MAQGLLDPRALAFLSAAGGLLQASGPSRTPIGTGQALGMGLQSGLHGYQQGLLSNQQYAISDMRMEEMRRAQEQRRQQEAVYSSFEQSLPESERLKFRVAPMEYIKELNKKYAVGGHLVSGSGQSLFESPQPQQLVQVPVTGQPGVTQPTWMRPGQPMGTPVGGQNVPEILNPQIEAARARISEAGRPQVQTQVNVPPASAIFANENKLRDDHTAASKSFVGIRDAYNTVNAALSGPITAVSTLAGATKFMKMIDPESVVRESELNMALRSTGMMDRFLNLHNTVLKGQILTPNQAKEIKSIADTLYQAAAKQQSATDKYYQDLATQYGLSPDRVVRNQGSVMRPSAGGAGGSRVIDFNDLPD